MGLTGLILIQLFTFYFGIILNPLFLFLIPVLIVSIFWLIRHPEFTLLMIGFTSIIKGFLQEQVPLFETLDLTILLIVLLWLGLAQIFISGEWRVLELARSLLFLFALFSGAVLLSGLYTPSPEA